MAISFPLRALMALIGVLLLQPAALARPPQAPQAPPDGGQAAVEDASQKGEGGQTDWAIAELVRVDREMQQIREQLARIQTGAALRAPIEEAGRALAELKASPALACEAPADTRAQFNESLQRTHASLRALSSNMTTLWPWEEIAPAALLAMCGPPLVSAIEGMERGLRDLNSQFGETAASRDDLQRALGELEERKHEIVTQMSNEVASARVAAIMPWILVIIFTLGMAMMFGVRLFSPAIQSELVGSGQLVQFVTILILFGALLALGLADKLQEQTLGTLLGGLAGYVLSQGIGQRVRQSTLQTIRETAERLGDARDPAAAAQSGAGEPPPAEADAGMPEAPPPVDEEPGPPEAPPNR
jgi:hypothetical protein